MTCAYQLILPLLLLLSPAPLLAVTVDIDDTDTRIVYTGTWSPTGEYEASNNTAQYDNTATLCREVGGTASLVFIGTSVTVFCTRGPIGTWLENTSYSLDSGPVSLWTDNNTINSVQWRTTCYSSGDVPYGEHNITITNYGDWFFLDYIQIVTPNPPSGSSSSSEDSSSWSSSSASPLLSMSMPSASTSLTSDTTSQTPIHSGDLPPATTSSVPLSTGAKVGIAIGAVALCMALCTIFVLLYRRKKECQASDTAQPFQPSFSDVPFDQSSNAKMRTRYTSFASSTPRRDNRPSLVQAPSSTVQQPPIVEDRYISNATLSYGIEERRPNMYSTERHVPIAGGYLHPGDLETNVEDSMTLPPAYGD
ncbi:hypothetical protein CERSUDRAFT_94924 [Gelatoporia subvermispora B]|uniref:Uncharacterized protein n=1 Tax=Ceriporiopsis subvermispora (strain B) TaxID=914234 RepID=M2RDW8_CERS8|nr:hypothetical protein CERSUDRAFT_94924 [Gelatoporia subvermispora B]